MKAAKQIGSYLWDSHQLPQYQYTGEYPARAKGRTGNDAHLPEDPCFILGNSRVTAFTHISGQLELITGEHGWARLNHRPGNGYANRAAVNGQQLAGPAPVPQTRRFGTGYATYQAELAPLRVTRTLYVLPSAAVKEGIPAVFFQITLENTGTTVTTAQYEETFRARYCMLSQQEALDGADPSVAYRAAAAAATPDLAAVRFSLVPQKIYDIPPQGTASPYDQAPPTLYLQRTGPLGHVDVLPGTPDHMLRYSAALSLDAGQQVTLRFAVGLTFSQHPGLPEAALDVSMEQAASLWKQVLPDFSAEEDEALRWEMIWNAYVLRAMATYHQYFDETMIPQGSVYAYRLGQNASMRDHLQHALAAAYVWPELAKSCIRFVLGHLCRDGRILRQDVGYGYEDHGIYFESDPQLYLFMAVGDYLRITRDYGFLLETVHLYPAEDGHEVTVLDALVRAFVFLRDTVGLGRHGLVRMLNSDWSDSFFHTHSPNLYSQVAESHMNTTMALAVLPVLIAGLRQADCADSRRNQLADEMEQYRTTLFQAFLQDLGDRDYAPRCYIGFDDNPALRFGEDRLCLEAQIWLLQLEDFPAVRKKRLWKQVYEKLIQPEKLGARTRERPLWHDSVGIGEDGGIWYSHQGPLMVGVASFDPAGARNLMDRLTFHHIAQCYPDYWLGHWTAADSVESTLSPQEGLYRAWCDHAFYPYCAHLHAWMLYTYCRLFAKPGAQA